MPPWLYYFAISTKLNDLTDKCIILYTPGTDHSPLIIHFKSDERKYNRGPSFLKFSKSPLYWMKFMIAIYVKKYLNLNENTVALRT